MILVTGATGLNGAELVRRLAARGAQLAAGVPPYLADALAELFAERRKGAEAQVSPVTQTLLGRRPTSFDEFATCNAAIFRGEEPAPRV